MNKLIKLLFLDETGKYVIGQPPNIPLYVMGIALLGRLLTDGKFYVAFDLLFFGSAFLWSYLEIRYGSSLIRRIFGVTVLILIFASRLK